MAQARSILFVDAYDSFSQNIAAALYEQLSARVTTIRIDTDVRRDFGCDLGSLIQRFDAVVLGPGPGDPRRGSDDTGLFSKIYLCAASRSVPVLGICLGFQTLCLSKGFEIHNLAQPCHGHSKQILPTKEHPIFDTIDTRNIFAICYNSLGVSQCIPRMDVDRSRPGSSSTNKSFGSSISSVSRPEESPERASLEVLAHDHDGYVMAVAHNSLPFVGFQFHPESCKSNRECHKLLKNWFQFVSHHNIRTRPEIFSSLESSQSNLNRNNDSRPLAAENLDEDDIHHDTNSLVHEEILSMLMNATATSTSIVTFKEMALNSSRSHISQLVRRLSRERSTVMLEATKRGRFSIYALLGDPHLGLDQLNDSAENCCPLVTFKRGLLQLKSQRLNPLSSDVAELTVHKRELMRAIEDLLILRQAENGPSNTPFWGGFIGHMSYETGLDDINITPNDTAHREVDDLALLWVERSIVFDSWTSRIYIQSIRENDGEFIESISDYINHLQYLSPRTSELKVRSELREILAQANIHSPDRDQYNEAYDRCQEHLRAGNSYELCLTTEATVELPLLSQEHVFSLYQNMHAHNPVPYGAYIDLPNLTILSTSPELFMSWSRTGEIEMLPMKGTVKRTQNMTLARASEILSTPKESAENLMIADLIRHDLYTAIGYTSRVEVIKLCEVVEHETVYQLISHIRAYLPISPTIQGLARRSLAMRYGSKALVMSMPPGSMTGAPKKRSCEILQKLERRNRGVYSGVIGYFDIGGGGAWSVAIRTAFRVKDKDGKGDHWRIGAGGAITVLSNKEDEWEEMNTKLKSVLKGFSVVSHDL